MLYDKRWERTETKTEPWRQVLFDAANLIETKGWCQEAYTIGNGAHCAVGAMRRVSGVNPGSSSSSSKLTQALTNLAYHLDLVSVDAIEGWNDYPDRSGQEVIKTLREAAKVTEY